MDNWKREAAFFGAVLLAMGLVAIAHLVIFVI
ncbi:hypothetical protein SAMN06265795_11082 [Noviherbaspirillum humi]|uniref:Uncharacterized protein n=1 Tax=Noviherbaspirillum humi TaxID=1688639 RepID=A0A239IRD4_9BURK|nr:hypothetical protein SAMN06265795_11082 [Noviherbaspirillum humi]